jgi:hypothetical protein
VHDPLHVQLGLVTGMRSIAERVPQKGTTSFIVNSCTSSLCAVASVSTVPGARDGQELGAAGFPVLIYPARTFMIKAACLIAADHEEA